MAGMGTGTIMDTGTIAGITVGTITGITVGTVTGIGTTITGATITGTITAIGEVKRKGGKFPPFFLSLPL
jgi:hypothetical protein